MPLKQNKSKFKYDRNPILFRLYIEKKTGKYKQNCIMIGRITGHLWGGILSDFMFTFLCFSIFSKHFASDFAVFKVRYHFFKTYKS